jgi:peptidoglycan/xylan/chitin deacetylase (PgdA/CDA1 family)
MRQMNSTLRNITFDFLSLIPIETLHKMVKHSLVLPFYHSVTDHPEAHIRNLEYFRSIQNFKTDIDFFTKQYRSLSISELSNSQKEKGFFISFDDGLSEVYHNAIPYLIEKKVTAAIFINSDFIDNKSMFYRHKVSFILEELKTNSNSGKVADYLNTSLENIQTKIRKTTYSESVKLDDIAEILGLSFRQYLDFYKPYLSTDQIIEIQSNGFTVGNHSMDHPNFKTIGFEEQKRQIETTNSFIKDNFKTDPLYFSFPFGDDQLKNELFHYIFNEANIELSFGVSGLKSDDFKNHLHRIPMEVGDLTAVEIMKFQCFKYLMRKMAGTNQIKRSN